MSKFLKIYPDFLVLTLKYFTMDPIEYLICCLVCILLNAEAFVSKISESIFQKRFYFSIG
jgi:hypothetical protein